MYRYTAARVYDYTLLLFCMHTRMYVCVLEYRADVVSSSRPTGTLCAYR